jgi:uncharacterized NAD(P)/FAD-binding protein YdhS
MADREPQIIAIVGAGFSEAATAIQLLRQKGGPARRVLIERGPEFGCTVRD